MCPRPEERYSSPEPAGPEAVSSSGSSDPSAPPAPSSTEDPRARRDPRDRREVALADRYWDRVRLFALRRVGEPGVAEDVAQETLRRVIEALRQDRLRDPEALGAFVFQTARHVCSHHARGEGRRGRALERLATEPASRAFRTDALAALVRDERLAEVRSAMSDLEDADRRLLRAIFLEGRSHEELAEELGIGRGALRTRKHRALARLRDLCPSAGASSADAPAGAGGRTPSRETHTDLR